MFNLEDAIQSWKRSLKRSPAFEEGQIKEMETHMRDEIGMLMDKGFSAEDAFQKATAKFGPVDALGDEVYKTKTVKTDATPPWKQSGWVPALLPNYLKVGLRNIAREKRYSAINILGLAVGFTSILLIGWYILGELSYDTGYPSADHIYRITADVDGANRIDHFASTSPPMGPVFTDTHTGVKQFARLRVGNTQMMEFEGKRFYETDILFADSSFFNLFQLSFSEGDPHTALDRPNTVVLSHRMAQKYFSGQPALGKTVILNGSEPYEVTGVLAESTALMHLDLQIILPFQNFVRSHPDLGFDDWGWVSFYNYLLLDPKASPGEVEAALNGIVDRRGGSSAEHISIMLQPVQAIHLSPGLMGEIGTTTDPLYLVILGIAGLLILGISGFNFMNLATAQSTRRGKEIGVRKVLGAGRAEIRWQYFGESVLQSLVALLLAIVMMKIIDVQFGELLFPGHPVGWESVLAYAPVFLSLAILIGVAAGLYPAMILSSYEAAEAVKNRVSVGNRGAFLRNSLVVAQFAGTVILFIGTIVILQQLDYLRSKDLGFEEERVIVVPMNTGEVRRQFGEMRAALGSQPSVEAVTAGRLALDGEYGTVSFWAEGHDEENVRMRLYPVYFDFTDVLGMNMVEGRGFSEAFAADTAEGFIINEAAAEMLGWRGNAVGKELVATAYATGRRRVVGVVENFHYTPLHEEVAPLVLFVRTGGMHFMYARLAPNAIGQGLDEVGRVWSSRLPGFPFDYWFLDDRLDRQYQAEERFAILVRFFSVIAGLIACFGLYGLASFMAERRRKEIGIRKVHGATISQMIGLMTGRFAKLVGAGFFLALPVAYWAVNGWLNNFAYRVDPGIWIYVLAGLGTLAIALASVGGQAVRAARSNPVETLRSE